MIPRTLNEFSQEWLATALGPVLERAGTRIERTDVRYHDTPGQTADTVIIELGYEDESCGLPNRVFGKLTARNPEVQDLARSMDLYRREVSFYRDVDDVGLPVPRCYYADFDKGTNEFVLLLEDLSDGECPSWGITAPQAEAAIERLPEFHAKWWNQPEAKGFDWAIQLEEEAFWEEMRIELPKNMNKAIERLGEELPQTFIDTFEALMANYDAFLAYLHSRPFSLVHGDYHFKQIFFPRADGGGRFAVFDWQFPYVAPGPWDLARVMTLALPTQTRQERQSQILDGYLQQLHECGVENYSMEELNEDLGSGCIINVLIHANALGSTDLAILDTEASEYGVRWQDFVVDRVAQSTVDFDGLPFLEGL